MENFDFIRGERPKKSIVVGVKRGKLKGFSISEVDSKGQNRIDFQFEEAKYSIWVKNEVRTTKDGGKFIFRDNKGNLTIFVEKPTDSTATDFIFANAVKVKVGEDELIKILKAFFQWTADMAKTMDFPEFDFSELDKKVIYVVHNGTKTSLADLMVSPKLVNREVVYSVGFDGTYQSIFSLIKPDYSYPIAIETPVSDAQKAFNTKIPDSIAKLKESYKKAIAKHRAYYTKDTTFYTGDLLRDFNPETDIVNNAPTGEASGQPTATEEGDPLPF